MQFHVLGKRPGHRPQVERHIDPAIARARLRGGRGRHERDLQNGRRHPLHGAGVAPRRRRLTPPRINGERLWSRLMALGKIGATAQGGCNRQALTDGDLAGRRMFADWAAAAGCRVRVDAIGNLFVRRAGLEDTFPVVLTGSHLDTQPTGGKFDGVYGVLAGLEVIEALNDAGMNTVHPIEVGVWWNEEGCRFLMAMMGSAVWSGRLPLDTALALTDRSGRSVRQELERLGIATDANLPRQSVKGGVEEHIEEGPGLGQGR